MTRTRRIGFAPLLLLALLPAAWTEATEVQNPFARFTVPGDFNIDSRPDVLWQTPRGNLLVWLMDGLKPTVRFTNPITKAGFRASGTHDFDGDGNTDILWFHPRYGILSIWHMEGLNLLYESELRDPVFDAEPVSIFDFNGDHSPDILFQTAQGELLVYILGGNEVVEKVSLGLPPGSRAERTVVGAGDFDGDGDFDIVLDQHAASPCAEGGPRCASNDSVVVALMDGARSTLVTVSEQPDRNWRIGAVSDYNGDFNPDLIWYNTFTGQTAAWVMEGLKIQQSLIITSDAPGVIVGPR
jgi:hypothetical protein